MYRVLLVDDEIYVRKGLINLMDWQSLQYEICGEAENGQQAVSMIEELKPDLVIADIRMPILNGLGLIKAVKEDGTHQPLFIIVSGYHDFSYAQQALRYDVFDYILKPVDEEELEATLLRIAGELSKRRLTTLTVEKPLNISIIETLMNTDCSEKDADQFAAALNITAQGPYHYVILEYYSTLEMSEEEEQLHLSKLEDSLTQLISSIPYHLPFHSIGAKQFGLFVQINKLAEAFHTSTFEEAFRMLYEMINKQLNVPVSLYVGVEVHYLNLIADSAKLARESLNYRFAEDGKSVVFASETVGTPLYYFDIDSALYNKLLLHIEEHQIEACEESVQQIFQHFKENDLRQAQ